MTIEDRLAGIHETLQAILLLQQTTASAIAQFGTPEAAAPAAATAEKKSRTKAADTKVVAQVAASTVYWVIEKHNTVYAQEPGQPACSIEGAEVVTEAVYLAKKEEFAKKINAAVAQQSTAEAAPTATATAAAADTNSANTAECTFKQVVESLVALSKDTRPGKGRDGVMAMLNKYLPHLAVADRKVPALEALKKNAEILADVNAELAETPAAEFDPFA